MPEILLHYIWQQRLWQGFAQATTEGQPVEILSVGEHNRDAGPDFSFAHLRIGGQEWVGNIEIHVRASDWRRHRHHINPAYDNVILHVVCEDDEPAYNTRNEKIAQCVLQFPKEKDYLSSMMQFAQTMDSAFVTIPCSRQLLLLPEMLTRGWRETLLKERWHCKTESIQRLLAITKQDWVQAFYITLAHNFGFHTNSLPFERLALQTPLSYLLKHRDNVFQLTAILLGQSGLLDENSAQTDEEKALVAEYRFMQKKFSLTPVSATIWKRARLRPQNAPEVRIRQFAQLLHQSEWLFSQMLTCQTVEAMRELLELKKHEHRVLNNVSKIGAASIDILLINTLLPYRYAYAMEKNDTAAMQQAMALMHQIPAEKNTIIRQWQMIGQRVESAADSQALIHLFQHYCQHERCIHCEVGSQVFTLIS